MAAAKHTVELTAEQIAFVATSLQYSAQRLRDRAYDPLEDHAAAYERRQEQDAMIASIQEALRSAQ